MEPSISITKAKLRSALQIWEQEHRDGKTRSGSETASLSIEQVAAEGADHVWELLTAE